MALTPDQEKILKDVYKHVDSGELTEQEDKMLLDMFPTPQHLVVLRKALVFLSADERGLFLLKDYVNLAEADFAAAGKSLAVAAQVDERIRSCLLRLYQKVQASMETSLTEQFKATNDQLALNAALTSPQPDLGQNL